MREVITHINKGPDSPARVLKPERAPLRIAAIQEPWHGSYPFCITAARHWMTPSRS